MLEHRSPKLDIAAIALATVTLLLLVALGTYHRSDAPDAVVWPTPPEVQNACGHTGAYIAHGMLNMMGVGAYYTVGSLGLITGLLLMRREVDQPVLRSVGWLMSLVGVTTLASVLAPNWSPGPVVGAGGYLGAMGRAWLEGHFALIGSLIFATSVLLAGLLLSTDYFVFRAAAAASAAGSQTIASAGRIGAAAAQRARRRGRSDLDGARPIAAGLADAAAQAASSEDDSEDWEEAEYEEQEYEEAGEVASEHDHEAESNEEEEDDEFAGITVRTPTPRQSVDAETSADGEGESAPVAETADDADTAAPAGKPKKSSPSKLRVKNPGDKKKSERDEIIDKLDAADSESDVEMNYELPPLDLLLPADDVSYEEHEREVRRKAKVLEKTFKSFGFNVKVVEIETGPVIAQYEVELEAGLRLSKITGLADDLAIALRVPSVRIVAPIPGKNTVGIEVPNENRQLVRLREVIEETNGRAKRLKIPIYLGKDVAGNPMVVDLAALPHLLIAGRTGTGKSVCLNSIILSILMDRGPDEVRMLMIDPKMVELSGYRKLPHLMHPVVTDMKKAEAILAWAVDKMEERYALLARAGVRHVSVYNQLNDEELRHRVEPDSEDEWDNIPRQLPFIVIVADEIADLMMTAGKDVEQHIIRLAQKSRAVGIHLILATQKPTVDVITGLIKSNLPARIAFQVASRTDSRVVLDEMGAEKLLGNGDMLFLSPGTSMLLRGQGTYLSDDEITKVVDYVGTDDQRFATELMTLETKDDQEAGGASGLKNRDELYEAAVDVVVRERRGSVSLLQRCLGIGYGRAARLIDFMAEDGIVGQYNGSQAREVMLTVEDWEAMSSKNGGEADANAPPPAISTPSAVAPPKRSNKIRPTISEAEDEEEDAEEDAAPWEESDEGEDDDAEGWEEDEADDEDWEEEEDAAEDDGAEEEADDGEEDGEEELWDEESDEDWEEEVDETEESDEQTDEEMNEEHPYRADSA